MVKNSQPGTGAVNYENKMGLKSKYYEFILIILSLQSDEELGSNWLHLPE